MPDRWVSARCGVTVSYAPGADVPPAPSGWARVDGGWLCLQCRRQAAVDEAITRVGFEGEVRPARVRREAVRRIELCCDDHPGNAEIARTARCLTALIAARRSELVAAGAILAALAIAYLLGMAPLALSYRASGR